MMGATQIKIMAGGGGSSKYDPIDVAQYPFDEMKAAVEAAVVSGRVHAIQVGMAGQFDQWLTSTIVIGTGGAEAGTERLVGEL